MTIDDQITRVVNAYNSVVYALTHNEAWHGLNDEFTEAIRALRAENAARLEAEAVRATANMPRDFTVMDGKRWRPTADYRLQQMAYGFALERLWICLDLPGTAAWHRVP